MSRLVFSLLFLLPLETSKRISLQIAVSISEKYISDPDTTNTREVFVLPKSFSNFCSSHFLWCLFFNKLVFTVTPPPPKKKKNLVYRMNLLNKRLNPRCFQNSFCYFQRNL